MTCPCCGYNGEAVNVEDIIALERFGPREARFVRCLNRKFGRWVSNSELCDALWGDDINGGPNNPAPHLSMLKKRLNARLMKYGLKITAVIGVAGGRRLVCSKDAP